MFKSNFTEKLMMVSFIVVFFGFCIFTVYINSSINIKTKLYGQLQQEALNKTYEKFIADHSTLSFYRVKPMGPTYRRAFRHTHYETIYYSTDIEQVKNGIILKDINVTIVGPYIIEKLSPNEYVKYADILSIKAYKEYFYSEWKTIAKQHKINLNIEN